MGRDKKELNNIKVIKKYSGDEPCEEVLFKVLKIFMKSMSAER